MTTRKRLALVQPEPSDKPITQGMVLSWGKLMGGVLPVVAAILLSVWKFSGDTKAAEINMNTAVASLKESVTELRDAMHEASSAIRDLGNTAGRFDERLKALEREK